VLHASDLPCKRGITPIAVNVIPVLLCPTSLDLRREQCAAITPPRLAVCLSQYPSDPASKQQFDANQSTPDKCQCFIGSALPPRKPPARRTRERCERRKELQRNTPDHAARPEGDPSFRRDAGHALSLFPLSPDKSLLPASSVARFATLEAPQNEGSRAVILLTCKPFRITTYASAHQS
jgi:hypothetical protein